MKQFAFAVFGFCLLASVSLAQMPGAQPPPDPCAALAKFFNKDAEFTASTKVVVVGKKARDNQTMNAALLTQIRTPDSRTGAAEALYLSPERR